MYYSAKAQQGKHGGSLNHHQLKTDLEIVGPLDWSPGKSTQGLQHLQTGQRYRRQVQ